jgi:hypothetical protein
VIVRLLLRLVIGREVASHLEYSRVMNRRRAPR